MNKGVFILIFLLLCIVSVVSVGVSIYLYTNQNKAIVGQQNKLGDDEAMLAVIGTAIMLPEEKPTIISVTDREKLQDQEFFKKALNGDKVVIYEGIRRIFLYRPSLNKIIDIAPLVYNQPTPKSLSATPSPTKQATSSASVGAEEQGNFRLDQ